MRAGARTTLRIGPAEPLVADAFTADQAPVVAAVSEGLTPMQIPLAGLTAGMFGRRVLDTLTHPGATVTWIGPLGLTAESRAENAVAPGLVQITWTAAGTPTARKGQWLPLYQPEYANTDLGFVCLFRTPEPGILMGDWLVEWSRRAATNIVGAVSVSRHENRHRWTEFGVFVNGVLCGRTGLLYPRHHTVSVPFVTDVGGGVVRCELRARCNFKFTADAAGAAASTMGTRPPINVWRSIGTARVKFR